MNKTKETAILIVSFLLIPVSLLAVYLTGGDILPRIETLPQQTWNIQDIPLIMIAFIGAFVSYFGFKRKVLRKTFICSLILNLFWIILNTYAVITLWGDKY
jgi:hypothetical protein